MPLWVEVCEVAEVWGVPPWIVDEALGERKMWVYRQLAWTRAKRRKEAKAWERR